MYMHSVCGVSFSALAVSQRTRDSARSEYQLITLWNLPEIDPESNHFEAVERGYDLSQCVFAVE